MMFNEALPEFEELVKLQNLPIDSDGNLLSTATKNEQKQFYDYQYGLHFIHQSRGDNESATKAIDRMLAAELPPWQFSSFAWMLTTVLWEDPKLRDAAGARRLALKACDLAPHDANNWCILGVAHYRNGDWKEAVDAIQKSLQLSDLRIEARATFFLAMAYSKLGQHTDAMKSYSRAVDWMEKNQPESKELQRFRAEAEELLEIKTEPSTVPATATKAEE
jgi:tetratricopeptide (TPR) repeat protein